MVAATISRAIIVVAGILYPAYSSFKAVRARSHREYTQWMMYWIVFAMFQAAEVLTDTFLSWYVQVVVEYSSTTLFHRLQAAVPGGDPPIPGKHETEIDETLLNIGERGKKVLGKVTQHGINLAATTVVASAIKGQAVITETLLQTQRAQQQQQQVDGGEAARPDSQDETQRQNRPSSSSTSSYYSEDYEVIGEAEPVENFEDPQETNSAQNVPTTHHPTSGDSYQRPDSNGLYHRT
ncbi:Receptor expression-enhancing protein 2 [Geodia barretti]|uniref:Receptor expression-enhancing protein n=1 Tax=Geodia barretti TaxID=519541 RepID=A0AA35THJ8_GEOBA|nr:Receptor expression-enhancing protein 2 [Geodia barretti]